MNSQNFLVLAIIVGPYILVHAIIIAILLRFRRRLPVEFRKVPRWLLCSIALPCVGPILSSIALSRMARCAQQATADIRGFRSDCGYGTGITYGLCYFAATWLNAPALGLLTLMLLVACIWQMAAALRQCDRSVPVRKQLTR